MNAVTPSIRLFPPPRPSIGTTSSSGQKDLGRTIDYIESRKDLDPEKIAFWGLSWGAMLGPLLVAVEDRIKTGIVVGGGLSLHRSLPEADPFNFAPYARQPMLMVNGRYDYFFPIDSTQLPLFRALARRRTTNATQWSTTQVTVFRTIC